MGEINDLRHRDVWEQRWKRTNLPKKLDENSSFGYQFNILMMKHLKKVKGLFLEIGCASGIFMIYFQNTFGFDVYGIDYSENGCKLAEWNLKASNTKGHIICDDVFECTELNQISFDIVFSGGFLEHFQQTKTVLQTHAQFLKPGGTLIIEVPNMFGIHGCVFKLFNKKAFHEHKKLSVRTIEKAVKELNIAVIETNYIGSFILESGGKPKWTRFIFNVINRAIFFLTKLFRFTFNSCYTSPYIVLIGKKFEESKKENL